MTEQSDVIGSLTSAGVLAGIRWSYLSATDRVREDYSEAAGHDATWLGLTRFVLFRDRLDRVFSCGRYALPLTDEADPSLDVLHAELTAQDVAGMPELAPNLVVRADLNGSAGWACGRRRWLLASSASGAIDDLRWAQKSPTKRRVARRLDVNPDQGTIFDQLSDADDELHLLPTAVGTDEDEFETFVVAHSQDVDSGLVEAVFGRPRLNLNGESAWHWRQDVLTAPPPSGKRRTNNTPPPVGPTLTPDAPVRLRRDSAVGRGGADGVGS